MGHAITEHKQKYLNPGNQSFSQERSGPYYGSKFHSAKTGSSLQMSPISDPKSQILNTGQSRSLFNMNPNSSSETIPLRPRINTAPIRPMIQKDGEEDAEEPSGNSDPLAKLLRKLIQKELADKKFQKHLVKLGKKLGKLAAKETSKPGDSPSNEVKRLTALNIPQLFKTTSKEIVKDPQLKYVRKRIAEIVGTNDLTALVTALAGGLAAYLADVDLKGKPSAKIGAGFTVGGMFNLGSAQDIQFKEIQNYVQYSNEHFKARLTGGLKNKEASEKTGEKEHLVGSGTGEIQLGSKLSHLMTRVSYNSDGELVVTGRFSSGTTFGKNEKFIFSADVSHMFATGETLFTPKIAGRFNLGSDQTLSIGSSLQLSNQKGLNRLTGFIEYKHDFLYLRIEGSVKGFEGIKSISPGHEMTVQGRLIIPLF